MATQNPGETTAPESTAPVRWSRIRSDEHLALCRVEMHAREAVALARAAGFYFGPLVAALDDLTAARAR